MERTNLEEKTDEELRIGYLSLVNSDDAWFSGKNDRAEKIKEELDRRGVAIYKRSTDA